MGRDSIDKATCKFAKIFFVTLCPIEMFGLGQFTEVIPIALGAIATFSLGHQGLVDPRL